MSSDVDQLVDIIARRVQERLGGAAPAVKLAVLPRDRGECNDDTAPGEDCAGCGVLFAAVPGEAYCLRCRPADRSSPAVGGGR